MYLWGGGAGPSGAPLAPFVFGASTTGLEGAGEDECSRSTSIGWGVGWSMADICEDRRWRSSGGRFSGCESRSYLEERLDEYELERRLEERSRSFTLEWVCLSGEAGGVPAVAWGEGRGARLGISLVLDDFFEDAKKEGRTMGASCGRIAAWMVSLEI